MPEPVDPNAVSFLRRPIAVNTPVQYIVLKSGERVEVGGTTVFIDRDVCNKCGAVVAESMWGTHTFYHEQHDFPYH